MVRKILFVILLLPISTSYATEKVLIITHQYNRPDFIEIQHKTFKKFLSDDYEYVVFNDAHTQDMADSIEGTCNALNIRCMRIPQDIHTRPYLPRQPEDPLQGTNARHANCVQYSMDHLGFEHDGIVFIIDSDMFLIRPFSIATYMHNTDIATHFKREYLRSNNVQYICPAICFLHMNKLPDKKSLNFNCGKIGELAVDSGGWTWFYLNQHPQLQLKHINITWSFQVFCPHNIVGKKINTDYSDQEKTIFLQEQGFSSQEINFFLKKPDTFELFLDNHFLHYRAGTNYNNLSQKYHDNKMTIFNEFLDDILHN